MEIKSVALLGAGAVGSYIIWGLSKLPDIRFGIIAKGSRAARLRDEGCSITTTLPTIRRCGARRRPRA